MTRRFALPLIVAVLCGCDSRQPQPAATADACPPAAVRVVDRFGAHLRDVSILGPDSVVARELVTAYENLAAPALLDEWRRAPRGAPGREVSSPWPVRIVISDTSGSASACTVGGEIVYVTTADTGSVVDRKHVTLHLANGDGGWRITSYDATASPRDSSRITQPPASHVADTTPQAVVRNYYAAIAAKHYRDAYALWSQNGAASGKSLAEFTKGFADTKSVHATVSDSVQLEGAAGSQYATVSVTVDAALNDGRSQHFSGTYTLRRSMVDGATPEQRTWHIYTARLSP